MTETEEKIVRILSVNVPYTLCDMYGHLRGNVDNCEIDKPLLDLCDRGVVRRVGKQRCMRGDRCMSCGTGGTLAYVLANPTMPDTAVKPTRPLPKEPEKDAERTCVACEVGGPGGLPREDDVAVIPPSSPTTEEDAKDDFVSARHFDLNDVARWFGVLPDELKKIETFRTRLDQRYAEASQAVRSWAERYFHLPSTEVNAEQIGTLQARVAQFEGQMASLLNAGTPRAPCSRCGSYDLSVSHNEPIKCGGCGAERKF